MVIKKEELLDPPSYDELVASTEGQQPQGLALPLTSPGLSSSSSTTFPTTPSPSSAASSTSSSAWGSWLPWNKTQNEVNANVHSLIRQIVISIGAAPTSNSGSGSGSNPGSGPHSALSDVAEAAEGILHSCADACFKHSVSLSSILQERYIETHSPLYWAIVKQPGTPRAVEEKIATSAMDVFNILLSYALPITKSSTIHELRLACLSTSNQRAFQTLRLAVPLFSSLSGTDRILLGPSSTLESDVDVTLGGESDGGAFAVDMRFPEFHKRLMVNKEVGVEFVVRNRIWQFSLMFMKERWSDKVRDGCWGATLSLQDSSPPTWFDGRLVLADPFYRNESGGAPAESASQSQANLAPTTHFIRMRSSRDHRLEPSSSHSCRIGISLEEEPAFSSLQYAESSYIPPNGVLTLRLEARLSKPAKNAFLDFS